MHYHSSSEEPQKIHSSSPQAYYTLQQENNHELILPKQNHNHQKVPDNDATIGMSLVLGIALMDGQLHLLMDARKMLYHLIRFVIQTTNTWNRSEVKHTQRIVDNLKQAQSCGFVLGPIIGELCL